MLRWCLVLLVLLVRGGVLVWQRDRLGTDPDGYRALAENVVRHGVLGHDQRPSAYRPPLYPMVLAACVAGPWKTEMAIAVVHFGLGAATVWLTIWLGNRWRLEWFSYVAAGLVACDPILVNQSTLVMTETLATFLAAATLALVTKAAESEGRRRTALAALAAASYALAALCRPTFLLAFLVTVAALVWLLHDRRQRLLVTAAMCTASAVVLLPWVVRNVVQFGAPIVTTTHGGYTLLLANNPDYYKFLRFAGWREVWSADRLDASLSTSRTADEVANDRHEYALAWQTIRERPVTFLYASLRRVGALWGVLPHRTAVEESLIARLTRYAIAAWYVVVFALALIAIASGEVRLTRPPWLFAAVLAASFTIAHLVYWTDLRMRAPLIPAISLVAAAGLKRLVPRRESSFGGENATP
jgi:4-amino-4-deoxy-L-arabinose transferase-like glycosyltransferase